MMLCVSFCTLWGAGGRRGIGGDGLVLGLALNESISAEAKRVEKSWKIGLDGCVLRLDLITSLRGTAERVIV